MGVAISKVILGRNTLIDLTNDTVKASDLAEGVTAHGANGDVITGTNTYDSNTTDATAFAGEILTGKTAYVNKEKITGNMANRGAVEGTISTVTEKYSIPEGYHDGKGTVSIDNIERAKIIPENIRTGVKILDVEGSYLGTDTSDATARATEILENKTAYVNANKLTGTMPNQGAVDGKISISNGVYIVPKGYHNGKGTVSIDSDEQAKIIPENIKLGVKILDVEGSYLGTDTSDATAVASEILTGKTAYVNKEKIMGNMPNNGAVIGTVSKVTEGYSIPEGYHNGNGTVNIDNNERSKIISGNIKSGVSILGIDGSYSGESVSSQEKSVTPYVTAQVIQPDSGYDYISKVNIEAIAYTETRNAEGGITVTIGTVKENGN